MTEYIFLDFEGTDILQAVRVKASSERAAWRKLAKVLDCDRSELESWEVLEGIKNLRELATEQEYDAPQKRMAMLRYFLEEEDD